MDDNKIQITLHMLIKPINQNERLWQELINYANNCDWEAWEILAQKMKENIFLGWEKIFVAIDDEKIIWFCTFTKEDWIPDCEYSPFVWFIFVDESYRWKRVSEKMINEVEKYAKTLNFEKLYIVSDHKWLYEKYWFEKVDKKVDELWRVETIFCRNYKK